MLKSRQPNILQLKQNPQPVSLYVHTQLFSPIGQLATLAS